MTRETTGRLRSLATLLRWLGPWAGERVPPGQERRRVRLDSIDAWLYGEREGARGVYLVVPGVHFLGPDDPRLDRFCRVLAAAGFLVVAPLLPDFLALRVAPGTAAQLAPAFEEADALARARELPPVTLLSISFGSMPALELAAQERYRARVGRLILFGGFCDFESAIRHAVTGDFRDPLNSPVVFGNLLAHLEVDLDRAALLRAWRQMVERTWGRMELKVGSARAPIAAEIAGTLAERERALFLAGCGLDPSATEWLERGLAAARGKLGFTDPRPHLARLRAPLLIVHGRDDDVIPFTEAAKLSAALGAHPHRVLLTGFFSHTGSALPGPRALGAEVATLAALLGALGSP